MFNRKRQKPKVRFHSLVPGVETLHPIYHSSKLNRSWVAEEKQEYKENKSKCPFRRSLSTGLKSPVVSIGNCPAIHSIMNSGYIVPAPADFEVHTNGDGETLSIQGMALPQDAQYVTSHHADQGKWLRDSTKDTTFDEVIKVNTPWRIICQDPDIIFLVTKVPFVNESRFSAVQAILDPQIAYEVNIQLWWHVREGTETVRAGTPLCCYVPMSRSLLNGIDLEVVGASQDDYRLEQEISYADAHVNVDNTTMSERVKNYHRIIKKYYGINR